MSPAAAITGSEAAAAPFGRVTARTIAKSATVAANKQETRCPSLRAGIRPPSQRCSRIRRLFEPDLPRPVKLGLVLTSPRRRGGQRDGRGTLGALAVEDFTPRL